MRPVKRSEIQRDRRDPFSGLILPRLGKGRYRTLILGDGSEKVAVQTSALAASLGLRVLVADGANSFDPYLVSRFASRKGLSPAELLKKIWVARAFTCHQFVTLVRERLEPMIYPGNSTLIVLLGPCTLFFDEEVPGPEAATLLRRTLAQVREMSRRGVPFLLGQSLSDFHHRREFLLLELMRVADSILRLEHSPDSLPASPWKPAPALVKTGRILSPLQSRVGSPVCGSQTPLGGT